MNTSTMAIIPISDSFGNYRIVGPVSMVFAVIAVFVALITLITVSLTKQLHTVTHLLICNTCLSSILYCIVQFNNYIYLLFITWNTSDISCRWRGYFTYMSVAAVIYSYLFQAISRLFVSILSTKYRWLISFKTHIHLILIKWMIVSIVPLPALLTEDIYFRAGFFCWVPMKYMLHIVYTIIVYYFTPIVLTIAIYICIYVRIHSVPNNAVAHGNRRRTNRDIEVLRNIMILLSIYILGAVPSITYMLSGVEFFYSVGIIFMSLTVTIEKVVSILLDREIRNVLKKYLCHSTTHITSTIINHTAIIK